MKKIVPLTTLALSAVLALAQDAQPGPGQPPPGRGPERRMMRMGPPPFDWWRNSDVAQKLNLSDQQKQQLEQAFAQSRLQLVDLKGSVEKEEIKLKNLMDADTLQEPQVLAQFDALLAARARLERNFAMMALTFRKILTSDQWKMLQQQDILKFHRKPEGGPPGPPPNNN
jgi:Spy/CpxP family protein refolding chaperone